MDTPRVVMAQEWTADELPLTYDFGYIQYSEGGAEGAPTRNRITTDALPVSQVEVPELPRGIPGTNPITGQTDYNLTVFVDVQTPFKSTTTELTVVQSAPPKNASAALDKFLAEAADVTGEQAVSKVQTALSIIPEQEEGAPLDPEVEEKLGMMLDMVEEKLESAPMTKNIITAHASVLSQVVQRGYRDNRAMDGLENLVNNAADAGAIGDDPTIANIVFAAMGSMLVDTGGEGGGGGIRAQSTVPSRTGPRTSLYQRFRDETPMEGGTVTAFGTEIETDRVNDDLSTEGGRLDKNHPEAAPGKVIITSCDTGYCDAVQLKCFTTVRGQDKG